MPIISIINNKGGVAKTTTTFQLATYLADKGFRVLLIDFDPQTSLTEKLPGGNKLGQYNIIDFLQSNIADLKNAKFVINENETLFALRGANNFEDFLNVDKETHLGKWTTLGNSLKDKKDWLNAIFDYVIIDCPPTMISPQILKPSEVALNASDYIIVPVGSDKDSFSGLGKVVEAISLAKDNNPTLKLLGVVFTLISINERIYDQYRTQLESMLPEGLLFDTAIRRTTAIQQSLNLNQSIFTYNPNSNGAIDYSNFGKEVLQKIKKLN